MCMLHIIMDGGFQCGKTSLLSAGVWRRSPPLALFRAPKSPIKLHQQCHPTNPSAQKSSSQRQPDKTVPYHCIEMSSAMAAGIEEEGDNLCDRCGCRVVLWFELMRFNFGGVGDDITLWQKQSTGV